MSGRRSHRPSRQPNKSSLVDDSDFGRKATHRSRNTAQFFISQGSPETDVGREARPRLPRGRNTAFGGDEERLPAGLNASLSRKKPSAALAQIVAQSSQTSTDPVATATIPLPKASLRTEKDETDDDDSLYASENPLGDDQFDDEDEYDLSEGNGKSEEASKFKRRHFRQGKPIRYTAFIETLWGSIQQAARYVHRLRWTVLSIIATIALFIAYREGLLEQTMDILLDKLDDLADYFTHHQRPIIINNSSGAAPGVPFRDFKGLSSRVFQLESLLRELSDNVRSRSPIRIMNFFAAGSGVIINPYLTSPTRLLEFDSDNVPDVPQMWYKYQRWFGPNIDSFPRAGPDPSSVFQPWDDAGECWCAPPSNGRSQIAMTLPYNVIPQELVVEHIQQSVTYNGAAMPRDVELWVSIENFADRRKVIDEAIERVDTPAAARIPTYSDGAVADRDQPSSASDSFSTRDALGDSWVRIGRWRYQRENQKVSQGFRIPVELARLQVPVRHFVVRTTSSWGESGSVCIYRLKLYGQLAYLKSSVGSETVEA